MDKQIPVKRYKNLSGKNMAILAVLVLILMIFCNFATASEDMSKGSHRYSGENTTLFIDHSASPLTLDNTDYGKTTIMLLSQDKSVLFKKLLKNSDLHYVTYSHDRHAFVLAQSGIMGVIPETDAFMYLPEKGPAILNSSFNAANYVAFRAVPSSDGRFIAFIGCLWNEKPRLYVLDTRSDKIRLLGEAPAPPPLKRENCSKEDWAEMERMDSSGSKTKWPSNWVWDNPSADNQNLEPDVCKFVSPNTLRCSYGYDTFKQRSQHRHIRLWDLSR